MGLYLFTLLTLFTTSIAWGVGAPQQDDENKNAIEVPVISLNVSTADVLQWSAQASQEERNRVYHQLKPDIQNRWRENRLNPNDFDVLYHLIINPTKLSSSSDLGATAGSISTAMTAAAATGESVRDLDEKDVEASASQSSGETLSPTS